MSKSKQPVVGIIIGTGAGAGEEFNAQNIRRTLESLDLTVDRVWCTGFYPPLAAIWEANGLSLVGLLWVIRHLLLGAPLEFVVADLTNGGRVVVGSRHGKGHTVPPLGIDWELIMLVLTYFGVSHVWAASACGVIEHGQAKVGVPSLVKQSGPSYQGTTFFRYGPATHVSMADPTCTCQDDFLIRMAEKASVVLGPRVSCVTIPGPQFGSRLTSEGWQASRFDVVGQSFDPESRLAREAQVHYSCVAMGVDDDAKEGKEVSQTVVDDAVPALVEAAVKIFKAGLREIFTTDGHHAWDCKCRSSLHKATITGGRALTRRHKLLLRFLGQ
ncbi:hypothetical protein KJ903_03615 [Patescibacteria group bacterium]|nr:hypothetical protein [Patescibacteria group bacterium]